MILLFGALSMALLLVTSLLRSVDIKDDPFESLSFLLTFCGVLKYFLLVVLDWSAVPLVV